MEKNEIILKILKRSINIRKYVGFRNDTVLDSIKCLPRKEDLLAGGYAFNEDLNYIEIRDHAEERWNTRVGPRTTSKELKKFFSQLLQNPQRLRKIDDSFGLIDSDILFTYETSDDTLIITTFYGRRTINQSLYQIEALRSYNSFYNEQVMLELEESVLSQQKMPPIPMIFMQFDGVKTKYYLECYKLSQDVLPVILVSSIPGEVAEINLNKVPDMHINKSILLVLFLMRYRDYVWEYLQIKYEDKVRRMLYK